MGVKDLWKLLKPTARPVVPESLEGLVLGVDVSIWLNQAIKGMRDRQGHEISNAHLLVLFNRICKLLHYRIKPVFVFDGSPPPLKLKTLAQRRKRKQKASSDVDNLLGKRAMKMLEVHALRTVTGQETNLKVPKSRDSQKDEDIYELPQTVSNEFNLREESPIVEDSVLSNPLYESLRNEANSIDIHSDTFTSLPPEVQHDLLLEKKESQKHTYTDPEILPKKADDFSNYQLARLKNRNSVTRKLDSIRKSLNASHSASYGIPEDRECDIEANRIESTEGRHYLLIRGKNVATADSRDEGFLTMDFRSEETRIREEMAAEEEQHDNNESSSLDKGLLIDDKRSSANQFETLEFGTGIEVDNSCDDEAASTSIILPHPVPHPVLQPTTTSSDQNIINKQSEPIPETTPITTCSSLHCAVSTSSTVSTHNQELTDDDNTSCEPIPLTSHISTAPQDELSVVTDDRPSLPVPDVCTSHTMITIPDILLPNTTSTVSLTDTGTQSIIQSHTNDPSVVSVVSSDSESDASFIDVHTDSRSLPPVNDQVLPKVVDQSYTRTVLEDAKKLMKDSSQHIENVLEGEVRELEKRVEQKERQSVGVTNVMYKEAQELLKLFGLPYIESPSEAEAQCAILESLSLTQGTITDDNDVLLFGGQKVYRNMFAPDQDIELYSNKDIGSLLGLDRDKLIVMAYFLGSDYTDGLEGIGCVNAVELLQIYTGEGLEPLRKIRERNTEAKMKPGLQINETNIEKKVRLLDLPNIFPDEAIRNAYTQPSVDSSTDPFEWGKPDLDLLRQFTLAKFGWRQDKCDSILLPVIKRCTSSSGIQQQTTITSYTVPRGSPVVGSGIFGKSKRLRNAVARLSNQTVSDHQPVTHTGHKRTRGAKGRGQRSGRGKRTKVDQQQQSSVSSPCPESPLSSSSSSSSD